MRDRDRCECCGSWEAECSSDTPQKGCGCMRCAAAENNRLLKEIQTWKEKYEDLEINRADCCVQMEKERDEARKQLADLLVDEEAEARFEKLLARNRTIQISKEDAEKLSGKPTPIKPMIKVKIEE